MKRCPQCYEIYENTEFFCEADGQRLLGDPALLVDTADLIPDIPKSQSNQGSLATGLIGVLTGVILCCGAYFAYSLLTMESGRRELKSAPYAAQDREPVQSRQAPARVIEPVPVSTQSPTQEPEAAASPAPAKPQPEQVSARLNRGPVSTSESASQSDDEGTVKTIIEMQDGSMVVVDAAWKDAQGVWYRRGGLVSFVEGPRVKAITARAEPKASPASNQ